MCNNIRGVHVKSVYPDNIGVVAKHTTPLLIRLDSISHPEFWIEIQCNTLETRGRFSNRMFRNGVHDYPMSRWLVRDSEIEVSSSGREVVIIVSLK